MVVVAQLPPEVLAQRIRDARQAAGLKQRELAELVGVDIRNVQNWENLNHPRRPQNIAAVEKALGVDLRTPRESTAPRLDEASDAQWVAEGATRLADRDRENAELRRRLTEATDEIDRLREQLHHGPDDAAVLGTGRWAARDRDTD